MPVTTTSQVVQSLESVTVNLGGSISVTIKTSIEGAPDTLKMYAISQEEAVPYWVQPATANKSRWEDLCGILYKILVDRGDLKGSIS